MVPYTRECQARAMGKCSLCPIRKMKVVRHVQWHEELSCCYGGCLSARQCCSCYLIFMNTYVVVLCCQTKLLAQCCRSVTLLLSHTCFVSKWPRCQTQTVLWSTIVILVARTLQQSSGQVFRQRWERSAFACLPVCCQASRHMKASLDIS